MQKEHQELIQNLIELECFGWPVSATILTSSFTCLSVRRARFGSSRRKINRYYWYQTFTTAGHVINNITWPLGDVSNKGSAYLCTSSRNTRHVDLMYEATLVTSKKKYWQFPPRWMTDCWRFYLHCCIFSEGNFVVKGFQVRSVHERKAPRRLFTWGRKQICFP
jgi:hypothetical protein